MAVGWSGVAWIARLLRRAIKGALGCPIAQPAQQPVSSSICASPAIQAMEAPLSPERPPGGYYFTDDGPVYHERPRDIHDLPDDVLLKIFKLLQPDIIDRLNYADRLPKLPPSQRANRVAWSPHASLPCELVLSAVCRRWRKTALRLFFASSLNLAGYLSPYRLVRLARMEYGFEKPLALYSSDRTRLENLRSLMVLVPGISETAFVNLLNLIHSLESVPLLERLDICIRKGEWGATTTSSDNFMVDCTGLARSILGALTSFLEANRGSEKNPFRQLTTFSLSISTNEPMAIPSQFFTALKASCPAIHTFSLRGCHELDEEPSALIGKSHLVETIALLSPTTLWLENMMVQLDEFAAEPQVASRIQSLTLTNLMFISGDLEKFTGLTELFLGPVMDRCILGARRIRPLSKPTIRAAKQQLQVWLDEPWLMPTTLLLEQNDEHVSGKLLNSLNRATVANLQILTVGAILPLDIYAFFSRCVPMDSLSILSLRPTPLLEFPEFEIIMGKCPNLKVVDIGIGGRFPISRLGKILKGAAWRGLRWAIFWVEVDVWKECIINQDKIALQSMMPTEQEISAQSAGPSAALLPSNSNVPLAPKDARAADVVPVDKYGMALPPSPTPRSAGVGSPARSSSARSPSIQSASLSPLSSRAGSIARLMNPDNAQARPSCIIDFLCLFRGP
ncbi:uncharacterized protein BJ171DRAFT_598859 [Polychytrium aggregatum]|uniref:uncharacterized protein n=1 Tax=Polychytrium aggregatum TaxID=110093 RepID=UPI0022FDEDB5|nr:uncharacterized protein BJ171DRAFT_598859 [Polychytrium aggregatum]KAI9204833.1 hypothetical protein BJ171DRAFT_598859 [Polychytrium aggregatum]